MIEAKRELENLVRAATGCRECFTRREVQAPYINVAQPRWVGQNYWTAPFRVAILMLNPGPTGPLLKILRPTVVLASSSKVQGFGKKIAAIVPEATVIKIVHYAHREGRVLELRELTRVRSALKSARRCADGLAKNKREPTRLAVRADMTPARGSL